MKNLKQTSPIKKVTFLTLAIVLLCVAGYGVFAKQNNKWPFLSPSSTSSKQKPDVNYKAPSNDQAAEGERIKERSVDQTDQATPPASDEKKEVSATITSANQNNGKFQVRFLIHALDTGTCVLRLTKGSTTVTKTSATQTLPSSMTCQGFDVPISELSSGEWTYTMTFTGKDYTASATDKVTIE